MAFGDSERYMIWVQGFQSRVWGLGFRVSGIWGVGGSRGLIGVVWVIWGSRRDCAEVIRFRSWGLFRFQSLGGTFVHKRYARLVETCAPLSPKL